MKTRLRAAAGLAFVLSCVGRAAPVPEPPPPVIEANKWGANDDYGIGGGGMGPRAFVLARESGMGWMRYWLYWDVTQPRPGAAGFDWTVPDAELQAIRAAGLNVYINTAWAPGWATPGCGVSPETGQPVLDPATGRSPACYQPWYCVNPARPGCHSGVTPDVAAFQEFVRQAARRYPFVKYWGFANEDGNRWFWRGGDVVDNKYIPGYDAVKSVNPQALVVGPETDVPGDLQYFLGRDQQRRYLDVISFHAYGRDAGPASDAQIDAFRPIIERYGAGRPVWIGEAGAPASIVNRQISEQWQAAALGDLYGRVNERRWIDKFFLYRLKSDYTTGTNHAIIDDPGDQPRPAYATVKAAQSRQPIGVLESAADGVVLGWALDPDSPEGPLEIHLYFDGAPGAGGVGIPGIWTSSYRADVNQATGYKGNHGFRFDIPPSFRDGMRHTVGAYAINTGPGGNPALDSSPQPLFFTWVPAAPPTPGPTPPPTPTPPPPTNPADPCSAHNAFSSRDACGSAHPAGCYFSDMNGNGLMCWKAIPATPPAPIPAPAPPPPPPTAGDPCSAYGGFSARAACGGGDPNACYFSDMTGNGLMCWKLQVASAQLPARAVVQNAGPHGPAASRQPRSPRGVRSLGSGQAFRRRPSRGVAAGPAYAGPAPGSSPRRSRSEERGLASDAGAPAPGYAAVAGQGRSDQARPPAGRAGSGSGARAVSVACPAHLRRIADPRLSRCYEDAAILVGHCWSRCDGLTRGEDLANEMNARFPGLAGELDMPELVRPGYAFTLEGCQAVRLLGGDGEGCAQ